MALINNSGIDQRIPLRNLSLYNAAPRCDQCHSELKNQVPPPYTRENLEIMPKAKEKTIIPDEEEEIVPYGVINTEEAKIHALSLKKSARRDGGRY